MMARTSDVGRIEPDSQGVAVNRLRFLTSDRAEPNRVRPPILASWERSRALKVPADRIELPYVRDPEVDTPLTRSAEPILRQLHEQLNGQSVSIILTDPSGVVLSRRTPDASLERHLDRVLLAPGFSYAEEHVGTNGIGTALESGAGTLVFGHEHYAENLEDLACAGVPIHDPMTGRTVGAVDLTCYRKDAESLLLTLAEATAEQIRRALLVDSGLREFEVLRAYRRTCRRTSGIVFALTGDSVMLNDHARADLEPSDQAALLAHAEEAGVDLDAGNRRSVGVLLPTGATARMFCHQVGAGSERAGLVVHVKVADREPKPAELVVGGSMRMLLPGLVGDSPAWRHACQQVETAFAAGDWLAVQGEAGVGKLALLRAVQLRRHPTRRFSVIDAAQAGPARSWTSQLGEMLAGHDSVLVRHVDLLDARNLRVLANALRTAAAEPRDEPLWVAVTLRANSPRPEFDQVLTQFPTTVEVPPLRLRMEDLPPLVSFMLAKLGHGGRVSCSSEAMRVLKRSPWPGNVEQLHEMLHQVVQHRRSGTIEPQDLPPEMFSTTRRVLTPLEALERDAIVSSLADTGGNKVRAAQALGMSRATIYRKIHEYGIIGPG